jgi:hypothetical protein
LRKKSTTSQSGRGRNGESSVDFPFFFLSSHGSLPDSDFLRIVLTLDANWCIPLRGIGAAGGWVPELARDWTATPQDIEAGC